MALASGTKLGPYEIQAPLGAGGMGEVYRARDTRLERSVAIKILPAHLSENAEAKQRFEREARTISSLNHPNICVLHDVGSQDGTSYLVMELVQGESLDARLQKGPLPLKQALECGVQICDALEKAHRAGIVHRDLKPGNIMLTPSGAKLLDFGLAKPQALVLGASAAEGSLTPSTPTMNLSVLSAPAKGLTQQGTVVGTFQYMAPEVLRGEDADARSDIFSLGCVLYEMVTGRHAFEGKSQLSVMTAILEKDPDPLSVLQPASPAALDHAVGTSLEKNPEDRFQSAHDLKLQLAWIARSGSQMSVPIMAAGKRKFPLWPLLTAACLLALVVVGFAWWRSEPPRQRLRFSVLPPEGTHFAFLNRNGPAAFSEDGTRVAFVANRDGKTSIWVSSLQKNEMSELAGTEGGFKPFWSPDGHSIGFFANGKMWRVESSGGSPIAICDAPNGRGASWGTGNTIVFAPYTGGTSLQRVSANGGTPANLFPALKQRDESYRWPVLLPDGKHVLYLYSPVGAADEGNEIRFASVEGGKEKVLLRGDYTSPQYASGWLLTTRNGALTAYRLDPSNGDLTGDPVPIANNVMFEATVADSTVSVSQTGLLAYQEGSAPGERPVWMDSGGKQITALADPSVYGPLRLSPDGTRLASAVLGTGDGDSWVLDLIRGARATAFPATLTNDTPIWSADGRTLYLAITKEHVTQIYQRAADGSSPESAIARTEKEALATDVTSDGKWLLYEELSPKSDETSTLKAISLVGEKPFSILDNVDSFSNARLMPGSNQWLAYQASDSGRSEVYLTHFPDHATRYQVSTSGGTQPVWSRDGKRLYYLDPSRRMTAVEVTAERDNVHCSVPKALFQSSIRTSIPNGGFDVARDGRFVVVNSIQDSPAPLTLITNWDAELKK
jgi:eukaryotic-like serine/threonine-protein kinase